MSLPQMKKQEWQNNNVATIFVKLICNTTQHNAMRVTGQGKGQAWIVGLEGAQSCKGR